MATIPNVTSLTTHATLEEITHRDDSTDTREGHELSLDEASCAV
jgi:hypothetical protein